MSKFLGVWVKTYNSLALPNLINTEKQVKGFYNTIIASAKQIRGGAEAFDQDFEQSGTGMPAAGSDAGAKGVELHDLVYFSGHGSPTGPLFAATGTDDGRAKNTEVRWGDFALKWMVLDACWLLAAKSTPTSSTDVISRWRPAFRGLHCILGFRTACTDETTRGTRFASYLNEGDTVIEAWKKACEESEEAAAWAYLRAYSPSADTLSDQWIDGGFVSPDPPANASVEYKYRTMNFFSALTPDVLRP